MSTGLNAGGPKLLRAREDASQVRAGTAPQIMASLHNFAIGVLNRARPGNLATALRHHARDPYDRSPPSE